MLGMFKRMAGKPVRVRKVFLNKREKKDFEALRTYGKLKPKYWFHFLIKLYILIIKNYKLMIRSKMSSLIFFLGPLLIISLVSIGFNTSTLYDINIAVHSESYSPLAEELISNLFANQYNVEKVLTEQDCMNAVKLQMAHICLIFPKDMVLDNSGNNNLDIYVDNSRLNIANQITESLSAKVALRSSELSSGMVSQILGAIDNINKEAVKEKTYIEALDANNKKSKTLAISAASDLGDFDFSYTLFDLNPILNSIGDIRNRNNMSTTDMMPITDKLYTLKDQYNEIAGKLDESKNKADTIESGVTGLAQNIGGDRPNLNSLKQANDEILVNVNTIKITNVESIVSPLRTTIKPLTLNRSYLVYTFPTLLVLLIMFVSLLMSATSIMREKKSMAYFRNYITPTFDGLFMLGQFITDISIIFVQLLIILGVASIFIKGLSWQVFIVAGAVLLLLASIFILIGLFLGYIFRSEESVTAGAVSVGLLFLLFSNAILPLETLTGFLRQIVLYNPFVLGEIILKRIILFEAGFSALAEPLILLFIWVGVTLILAILAKLITKGAGK